MPLLPQLASLLSLASVGLAQFTGPNIIPFQVTGGLDDCSVVGTEYNSGGSIRVNQMTITVPKNLIAQFPTVWAPFAKVCGAGAGGFETTVTGNIVGGTPIAGQIQIAARFGLEGSQGYIASITNGVIQIVGGPKVRINDPEGAFAPKTTLQPFFVIDTENPSVASFSGFPMCIQHAGNAETCKDSNRPTGQTNFRAPDPLTMVPFKAGDFIEFSGLRNGADEILAYAVNAVNVQVTTQASDTEPNYLRVEEFLIGVNDPVSGNVEVADIRMVGYASSCSGTTVTVSAIDVDPCTGVETLRRIGSASPRLEVRCKWEMRINTVTPYAREYLVTSNTPVTEQKNGIKAGQYVQPVAEWIFPEVNVPGTNPPPLIFTDIKALVNGDVLDDQQFGQLDPFPGPNPGAPSKQCKPSDLTPGGTTPPTTGNPSDPNAPVTAPVAAAAQFANVQRVGALLSLAGSNTAQGLNNDQLNFAWTQTTPSSPAVSITNPSAATATITAPKVTTETTFNFTLTVSLKSNSTISSKVVVPIKVNPTTPDVVTIDTYTWENRQSGTIAVSCSSNVRNGDNKKMTLLINGVTNIPMAISGGNGRWAYTARSTARPNRLQCVSDLTGKSAERLGTATTRRRKRGVLGLF